MKYCKLLLILLLASCSKSNLTTNYVIIDNGQGLQIGSAVKIDTTVIGSIENISVRNRQVVIKISTDANIAISKSDSILIKNLDIISGEKFIAVVPNRANKELAQNDTFYALTEINKLEILPISKEKADSLIRIADSTLNIITEAILSDKNTK